MQTSTRNPVDMRRVMRVTRRADISLAACAMTSGPKRCSASQAASRGGSQRTSLDRPRKDAGRCRTERRRRPGGGCGSRVPAPLREIRSAKPPRPERVQAWRSPHVRRAGSRVGAPQQLQQEPARRAGRRPCAASCRRAPGAGAALRRSRRSGIRSRPGPDARARPKPRRPLELGREAVHVARPGLH